MKKKDVIYKDLKNKLLNGKFKANEVLKEEVLAEKYKVSRTPVREALQLLVNEGFLTHRRKVGYIVKPLTKNELREIVGIRSVLESYAARITTENYDEKLIDKLEKLIEKTENALKSNNLQKFYKYNCEFHLELYKSSGNKKLIEIIENLRENFQRYTRLLLNIENMPYESLKDHKLMIQAMKERDPEKVEKIVKKHILKGGEKLIEYIAQDEYLAFMF